jgi:hypothetical protein
MLLLCDVCQVEVHFGLFRDSINLGARQVYSCAECTMGMEIFSGTPDGTSW